MPTVTAHRLRDDGGAVAVITALVAVLLFTVAALAVDLSSAYARRLAVQTVADVAARDAAAALPSTCDAVLAGARSLAAEANRVPDDSGAPSLTSPASFAAVPAALLDDDLTNGEIDVYGPDLNGGGVIDDAPADITPCPGFATRVRVIAPPRTVRFSFGQLVDREQVSITASAVAGIVSALPLLPLAIPAECVAAKSHTLVVRQPGLTVADESPADSSGPNLLEIALPVAEDVTLRVSETRLRPFPAGYSARFSADGVDFYAATTEAEDVLGERVVTLQLPEEVRQRPGGWAVSVSLSPLPGDGTGALGPWSRTRVFTVDAMPIPVCDPSGRYGDLLTITPVLPKTPAVDNVKAAAADGLQYSLSSTVTVNGATDQNAVAERLSAGLLTRLTRPSPAPCAAGGIDLGAWSPGGLTMTANNALSCYFPLGPSTLLPTTIIDEPRAFLIPVVDVGDVRPVGTTPARVTGYYAAYVTGETPGTPGGLITTPGTRCSNTGRSCNGVQLAPSGSLAELTIFRFEASVLPEAYPVRDNGYPFTTGTRDVLLLQ